MWYFLSDIKKIYKNKLIRMMLLFMSIVMIIDPVSIYFINGGNENFFKEIGANPFQFWLLMNSVGWGHTVYFTLFWAFPIISTGLIFYDEHCSSVYHILASKKSSTRYRGAKMSTTFFCTFVNFLVLLLLNLLVTYLCFSSDAPKTEKYSYVIPNIGTFANYFYQISPFYMAVIYSILNALVIALLSVLVLNIHMMFNFKNKYSAFLVPFIFLYTLNYIMTVVLGNKLEYNLSIIIQPRAANAIKNCITSHNVIVVVGCVIIIDLITSIINLVRNKEIL